VGVAASDGVKSTGSTPSSKATTAADKQFLIAFIFIVALSFKKRSNLHDAKSKFGVTSCLYI
jgi:hypothetical protein